MPEPAPEIVPPARAPHEGIRSNIALAEHPPDAGAVAVLGCVCGSEPARRFWQRRLEEARSRFGARTILALHEDLPVNQAFGVLLAWARVEPELAPGEGALLSFVFGEGSRATPFTEAENGQKPAMLSFVRSEANGGRLLPMAELALRHFAPVAAHLRRSGFDGLVIKWGDEVQVPSTDLSGSNPTFTGADVVRFVSLRTIDEDGARNKDWVGVAADGRVTTFIPRRPLAEMETLADRGLLRRDGERLLGGVNLGSIALSRRLLSALLEEFRPEVFDPDARRAERPDLDPQFFTALTLACIEDAEERRAAWERVQRETAALAALDGSMPDLFERLVGVVQAFRARHGAPPRIVAMDFGEPYWGDIGQHRQIREFFHALLDRGPHGAISRALAGLPDDFDERGNLLVDCELPSGAVVRDSVLIDCRISEACNVRNSVLVGTRCRRAACVAAFDVGSHIGSLELGEHAGSYRVVDPGRVAVAPGKRLTSLFLALPGHRDPLHLSVSEDADLKARSQLYELPVEGNPLSFSAAHAAATALDPDELSRRREAALARVLAELGLAR